MASLNGSFELVKNENFLEYLQQIGTPADLAKEANAKKETFIVKQEGNKITINSDDYSNTFVLNEEVDEKIAAQTLKSTATLNGNVLLINAKSGDLTYKREFTITDSTAVLKLTSNKTGSLVATRTYKRL